jgi:hypothetical protein
MQDLEAHRPLRLAAGEFEHLMVTVGGIGHRRTPFSIADAMQSGQAGIKAVQKDRRPA